MGKLRQGRRRRGHTAPEAADRYASLVPWCWSPGSTQGLPPPHKSWAATPAAAPHPQLPPPCTLGCCPGVGRLR